MGLRGRGNRVRRHRLVRRHPIIIGGSDAQKKKYLGRLADTRNLALGAYAITEPEAGSDVAAMKTTARKVDGGYVLNGTKHFITNGGLADVYVVFATIDPAPAGGWVSAFIVEKEMGIKPGKKERKMGIRASHTAQIHLEDVFVPKENSARRRRRGIFDQPCAPSSTPVPMSRRWRSA